MGSPGHEMIGAPEGELPPNVIRFPIERTASPRDDAHLEDVTTPNIPDSGGRFPSMLEVRGLMLTLHTEGPDSELFDDSRGDEPDRIRELEIRGTAQLIIEAGRGEALEHLSYGRTEPRRSPEEIDELFAEAVTRLDAYDVEVLRQRYR